MFPLVLLGSLLGLALMLGQKKAKAAQLPAPLPPAPTPTPAPTPGVPAPTPPQVPTTYTVVTGDSPWKIAQKLTGDGMRWRELVSANPQKPTVVQADGSRTFKSLFAGEVLRLPESWRAAMAQTAIYMPEETITARRA